MKTFFTALTVFIFLGLSSCTKQNLNEEEVLIEKRKVLETDI